MVNSSLYNGGEVNILTGADGLPNGAMLSNPGFYEQDLANFGNIPGVNVLNINGLTSSQINGLVSGTGTTIGAFCNSGVCLAPFM
jgi:hypothetical protein